MKKFLIALFAIFFVVFAFGNANAVPYNVAQGSSVSLSGDFFTEYQDWSTSLPDGSPASQTLIDSIVDGVFLPEGTQWDQGTLWWDEHDQIQKTVFIDLDQICSISKFIVQADNNDTYEMSYLDNSTLEWTIVYAWGGWGMRTRPEFIPSDPILTNQLAIKAIAGDDWYSLSEVQAYGNPIPEPATILLLCLGLIGIVGTKKKFKK